MDSAEKGERRREIEVKAVIDRLSVASRCLFLSVGDLLSAINPASQTQCQLSLLQHFKIYLAGLPYADLSHCKSKCRSALCRLVANVNLI